jgi:hypothetical protein
MRPSNSFECKTIVLFSARDDAFRVQAELKPIVEALTHGEGGGARVPADPAAIAVDHPDTAIKSF